MGLGDSSAYTSCHGLPSSEFTTAIATSLSKEGTCMNHGSLLIGTSGVGRTVHGARRSPTAMHIVCAGAPCRAGGTCVWAHLVTQLLHLFHRQRRQQIRPDGKRLAELNVRWA